MAFERKNCFIIVLFAGLLFFLGPGEPSVASDIVSGQEISLPAPGVEPQNLTLISVSPFVVQGQIWGAVAIYDDPRSSRPADYLELYDNAGHLLAMSWFDRFGIERTAVDRGLLEESERLEGVFVVLLDGDAI
jgi:hypothetical protein